jgi:hypothetical protein
VPSYPGYPGPTGQTLERAGVPNPGIPDIQAVRQTGTFGYPPEEAAYTGAPPPFPQDYGGGLPTPGREPSGGAPPPARRDVSADDILSNIEGSEEVLYSEAFTQFPGGFNGFVMLDCTAMRDFICTNSAISMEDIDLELLKVASPDEGLSRDGFLHLLREFSVADGDAISQFMGLSSDHENLAAEECRSGLMLFAQQQLSANFGDDRWECIFNTVMWDAGVTVTMEQWMAYTKLTGRIVRLLRFARV